MPSGRSHVKLAIATTLPLILGAWTIYGFSFDWCDWSKIAVLCLGYLTEPLWLSCDLDLPATLSENNWHLLKPIWWPYQMLTHRSTLSHWPPLSAILRVIYLWLMLFLVFGAGIGIIDLVWYGLFKQIPIPFEVVTDVFVYWLWVWKRWWWWLLIGGIALGDMLHFCADKAVSFMSK